MQQYQAWARYDIALSMIILVRDVVVLAISWHRIGVTSGMLRQYHRVV